MYRLDRVHKYKIAFGFLAIVFFVLCVIGFAGGGNELIQYGFMNTPLFSIMMVVSLCCAIVCLAAYLTINALEKDISEWLEILDTKANRQ